MTEADVHAPSLDGLLQEIRERGSAALEGRTFPYVEGDHALFVYEGPADAVTLHHWIFGLESAVGFHRAHGDVWTLVIEVQATARVEYKLAVEQHGDARLIRDPLNPNLARDPFGANSVVTGPAYTEPWWALEDRSKHQGRVVERKLKSDVFGDVRPISIYEPPRYRTTRRYPLLIVHDGLDYLKFAGLKTVLDNLIDLQEIPPLVVCCTQSPNRIDEYAANDSHARFVKDELLPLLEDEFSLLSEPADRALMGASFGAVASLHAALRSAGTFGKLLLQSGSFAFTDIGWHDRGPVFDPVVEFVNGFRRNPVAPADEVFLSCGTYESLIVYNRSMEPLLRRLGVRVRLVEAQDGHNWENWRDQLRAGLTWLFPGPLWMVYE